jgi:hypothetical protein
MLNQRLTGELPAAWLAARTAAEQWRRDPGSRQLGLAAVSPTLLDVARWAEPCSDGRKRCSAAPATSLRAGRRNPGGRPSAVMTMQSSAGHRQVMLPARRAGSPALR